MCHTSCLGGGKGREEVAQPSGGYVSEETEGQQMLLVTSYKGFRISSEGRLNRVVSSVATGHQGVLDVVQSAICNDQIKMTGPRTNSLLLGLCERPRLVRREFGLAEIAPAGDIRGNT